MNRIVLALLALLCGTSAALAIPNALNYQGQLFLNGNPTSGPVSITFRMFAAPTGGTELWAETDAVTVTGGLFSAILGDGTAFPAMLFTSQVPWLEMEVSGQVLSPRTQFQSVPYALNAPAAAGNELWETDGANVWRAGGYVGIGTTTPGSILDILSTTGNHDLNAVKYSSVNPSLRLHALAQGNNQSEIRFLKGATERRWSIINDVTGSDSQTFGLKDWVAGSIPWVIDGSGNVGIGTTTPTNRLQVTGNVSLTNPADVFQSSNGIVRMGEDVGVQSRGKGIAVKSSDGTQDLAYLGYEGQGYFSRNAAGNSFNTLGAGLGNGSVYSILDDDHLAFVGNYGYGVGDEYIDFQSGFAPSVGGPGTLARITANRNSEDWNLGRGRLKLSVRNGTSVNDMMIVDHQGASIGGNLSVTGALSVTGTKCRVVGTSFGQLKLNAVESGHALFMDDDPSTCLLNGRCRVNLSAKFMETVTVNERYPLAVSVTFYSPHGGEWYVERDATGFTVIDPSGSNAKFSWQVIARQRGYEDVTLGPVTKTAAR